MSFAALPVGRAVRGALTDIAQRGQLTTAIQTDNRKDTFFGPVRCGAAIVVAAALLRGEAGARGLLRGLEEPSRDDPRRQAVLRDAARDLESNRHLSQTTVQRLQDLLYEVGNTDGVPGTTPDEQDGQLRLAGLPTRPIDGGPPTLSDSASNSDRSRDVVPIGVPQRWRARLDELLQPGEAVPLYIDTGNPDMGHVVLFGRNLQGGLFAYDSAQTPGLMYGTNPTHFAAMNALLERATGFHGSRVIRVAG